MNDEIKPSLFILKSKKESLLNAEVFLKNRNWSIASTTELKEALGYIIQKQPQFVMISVDNPSPKIKALPAILRQAFSVQLIMFAETSSGNSMRALQETNSRYTLFPPVSGPAIERVILKIKKDLAQAQQQDPEATLKTMGSAVGSNEAITLKGSSAIADSPDYNFSSAREALAQMMAVADDGGNNTVPENEIGSTAQQGPHVYIQKGASGNFGNYMPTPSDSSALLSATSEGPSAESLSATSHGPKSEKLEALSEGTLAKMNSAISSGLNSDSPSDWGQFDPIQEADPESSPSRIKKKKALASFESEPDDETPTIESPHIRRQKKRVHYETDKTYSRAQQESLIAQASQEALDSATKPKSLESFHELEVASHTACILVQSKRFSGYLIVAMANRIDIDKNFVQLIQKRLLEFLKQSGETPADHESIELKLTEVPFQDWAFEKADFLRKSIHGENEVALAFFPSEKLTIEFMDSVIDEMIAVSIGDLKGNALVEFDLYIFMPKNNKFILYTPKGKRFYEHQKDRLKSQGIDKLHLRKETAPALTRYHAQNYLNEQISDYDKSK